MPRYEFVNRARELQAFQAILAQEGSEYHFLLIHGEAGMGKTALLFKYREVCESLNVLNAVVDLRSTINPFPDVLWHLSQQLGQIKFPEFTANITALLAGPQEITNQQQSTNNMQIQLALGGLALEERRERQLQLTKAFLKESAYLPRSGRLAGLCRLKDGNYQLKPS